MRSDPLVSPLFEPDLCSLPPTLIITVEHDPLRDEGDAYAAALAGAGVTVTHRCEQGMIHGFLGMDLITPAAATAGERFFDDVRRLLQPPRSTVKSPSGPVVIAPEEAGPVMDYPDLEQELGDLWVRVTRAGGAVGFLPDAAEGDVRAAATEVVESIRAGSSYAVGFSKDGLLAGVGFLVPQRSTVVRHRADVVRVMIAPELQRQGLGAGLLAALAQRARSLGLTTLLLSARGGTGAPQFYLSQGWTQWGVIAGSLRVSDHDWRDDVQFLLQL
jgi:acetyltransferase